jgi:hypothetical protein
VRVVEAYNLVVLHQIDVIGLQAAERLVQLSHRFLF